MAEVIITHGGLNTVLETLMEGKPMIILPMVHDQPAVAARLAQLKIAEVLPIKGLSAKHLRLALAKIRNDRSYRDAAVKVQAKIRSSCGVQCAADLIEEAIEKYVGGSVTN
jgi:UDP:flavonoid glycosyltransferase YjiC (YdhE family)